MAVKVLATGVFDLLHSEHKKFLQQAKKIGDIFIVGVEPDSRVQKMKGKGRPLQPQDIRMQQLQSLPYVDKVLLLPEDFGEFEVRDAFLRKIKPDILAVSSHTPHQQQKQELMEKHGGKLVIVHQHNPEVSTTKLLREEKNSEKFS